MGVRAIFLDAVVFLLYAFICFIYLGIYRFNILLSSLGFVFGLVFGVAAALKQISSLEKIGELRATLKTWAFMLLTIIILVPIALYLLFSLGPEAGIQMLSFIYPSIPALYTARIILFLNWERKHKRLILFEGLVFTRIYAVLRTERRYSPQPSEKVYCIYCGAENATDAIFCQKCGKKIIKST